MADTEFYGWYDDATQASDAPTYDPPHHSPCLYCGMAITDEDVRTHSLMMEESSYAKRSYFFRTHRTCHEADPSGVAIDGIIFDMIRHNGD